MTIELAEQGGKTRITWGMFFESPAECDQVEKYAVEGNEQNFDRLEAELAKMACECPRVLRRNWPPTSVAVHGSGVLKRLTFPPFRLTGRGEFHRELNGLQTPRKQLLISGSGRGLLRTLLTRDFLYSTMTFHSDAPLAQLDRALDFGSSGRGFESLRARHFFPTATPRGFEREPPPSE